MRPVLAQVKFSAQGQIGATLDFGSLQLWMHTAGRHNLRSFLAANLTQNYFLIAHMLSFFCDIRDKSAVFNILRQNVTIFDIGNG